MIQLPELKESILSQIMVRKVASASDYKCAMILRHAGYKKYGLSLAQVEDHLDNSPNATILIAENNSHEPLGTMRILDRTSGPIELDSFIDVPLILKEKERSCAEGTRLSVPLSPLSGYTKFALWKAFHRYCLSFQVATMLIWVRAGTAKQYRTLLFDSVGPHGVFIHPTLGNKEHATYALDVVTAESRYRACKHPYYRAAFCIQQPKISFL
jgi:hypothetical protein